MIPTGSPTESSDNDSPNGGVTQGDVRTKRHGANSGGRRNKAALSSSGGVPWRAKVRSRLFVMRRFLEDLCWIPGSKNRIKPILFKAGQELL